MLKFIHSNVYALFAIWNLGSEKYNNVIPLRILYILIKLWEFVSNFDEIFSKYLPEKVMYFEETVEEKEKNIKNIEFPLSFVVHVFTHLT